MPRRPGRPPKKPERRRRGTGSVYRRKDGLWAAVLPRSLGRTATYHRTEDAANAWVDAQLAGPSTPSGDTALVGPFLTAWYGRHKPRWSEETRLAYLAAIGRLKALHGHPVIGLKRSEAHGALLKLYESGYARSTVRLCKGVLHAALEEAVGDGLLPSNPVGRLALPREPKAPPRAYEIDEAERVVAAAEGHELGALVILVLTCGLRLREALALQRPDLDRRAGTLAVERAMPRKGIVPNPTTKGRRARTITLPEVTLTALSEHVDRQTVLSRWLFPHPRDPRRPITDTLAREAWYDCTERIGLPRLRFHDSRHTAATLLASFDTPVAVIAEILGHSSPIITQAVYQHVLNRDRSRAAEAMNRAFSRPKRSDKTGSESV